MADHLACFTPKPGDAVFLPAGTVHSLGGDVVVFEVQENSDVTFRLYDWDRVDAKTGQPRALQVDQALACIDFAEVAVGPVTPVVEATTPVLRERLFHCEHFSVVAAPRTIAVHSRRRGHAARAGVHRGRGAVGARWRYIIPSAKATSCLLPAVVGACFFRPRMQSACWKSRCRISPSGAASAGGNRWTRIQMKK